MFVAISESLTIQFIHCTSAPSFAISQVIDSLSFLLSYPFLPLSFLLPFSNKHKTSQHTLL